MTSNQVMIVFVNMEVNHELVQLVEEETRGIKESEWLSIVVENGEVIKRWPIVTRGLYYCNTHSIVIAGRYERAMEVMRHEINQHWKQEINNKGCNQKHKE